MITVAIGLLFHGAVTMPLILLLVARRSPWQFAKAMSPAMLTAFSTASSNGTRSFGARFSGLSQPQIDLIEELIGEGKLVASFPIHEYWMDIGKLEDYLQATDDILAPEGEEEG